MLGFEKMFGKAKLEATEGFLNRDQIAAFLKTSPEKLAAFEEYYQSNVLPNVEPSEEDFFGINAKDAAKRTASGADVSDDALENLILRIVKELIAQTVTYTYDGETAMVHHLAALPDGYAAVALKEITQFPEAVRPQLAGNLIKKDIDGDSAPALLWYLKKMTEEDTAKKREMYNRFRQGLDILDLDPLMYAMIDRNPISMGHWLPALVDANRLHGFFRIPKTTIAKVPITLLQLTRLSYESLTATTKAIVNRWAMEAFHLDVKGDYFIKTGTFSCKFDFRNCHVHDPQEVQEIGEYLLYIHNLALQMVSPLCNPYRYGASTTTEWVVREFVKDTEYNPVIYKGLPLHTEYRVFIDCDADEILGCIPYWDLEVMKKRFLERRDGHDVHDYISYTAHEETLMGRYEANKDAVVEHVKELLPDLDLKGQWSLDIMQNGTDFWLIDMASAERSVGYDKGVPLLMRRPSEEDWMPVID